MKRRQIYDNVQLDGLYLREIPDSIKIDVCHGFYDISENRIKSLKNCPKFVKFDFLCSENYLTSLEYGPEEVQGHYVCSNNKLTSLDGIARIVGGNIVFSYNNISSLRGLPQITSGAVLSFIDNSITSLDGTNLTSKTLSSFLIAGNKITSLIGSPPQVLVDYDCSDNPIESLVGCSSVIGRNFYMLNLRNLKSLDGFPKMIGANLYIENEDVNRIFGRKMTKTDLHKEIARICELKGRISLF